MPLQRFLIFSAIVLTVATNVSAFGLVSHSHHGTKSNTKPSTHTATTTNLRMSSMPPDDAAKEMERLFDEASKNPDNLKASADMLRNLKTEDLDKMLKDMDNMPPARRKQLEAMGMNPDLMRTTVEMLKSNPQMAKEMSAKMENLSPEEVMEKSRQAQAFFERGMTQPPSIVDFEAAEADDEEGEESGPVPPPDTEVLDTMYQTAELMSSPPTGKVTFAGFSTIPPVALLIGNDSERDLSKEELRESWADGSLGSTRVDRAGFERVWIEVQEYFSLPLMDKARERTGAKKQGMTISTTTPIAGVPTPEQLLKNMSDSDMDSMLEGMKNMSPEELKGMGIDPQMMQKTAELMTSNPMIKNATKAMMKNMSLDDMRKAGMRAKDQLSNLTDEEREAAIKKMDDQMKQ